jgi:hypothetical protein
MNETLRPSTLGEILDRTVQIYRYNFWLFAGTAALPLVLAFVLAIPAVAIFAIPGITSSSPDPAAMIRGVAFTLAFVIFLPLYLAIYVFSIAGITQAAVSVHRGEKLTIRAALKSVRPRFWTFLWYLLLQGIMVALIPISIAVALIGPLIYLMSRPGGQLASNIALGFLVFLVGAAAIGVIVWLALSYSMGMAVCVVELKTAWQSLTRSWRLSQGTRGRIFVLYLLIVALSMVATMISYFLAAMVAVVASLAGHGSAVALVATIFAGIVYVVVSIGAQIAIVPVSWIALVLFYYDQRIRKEGYDIEWMMQAAGLTQPPSTAPPAGGTEAFGPVTPPDTVPPDTVKE